MELFLIRHAPTFGNLEKRYIGRTDEPIVQPPPVPIPSYPQVERVYISPMLRCRQTARLLFRNCEPFVLDGLRECDFGVFEGKNYAQLCADSIEPGSRGNLTRRRTVKARRRFVSAAVRRLRMLSA